MKSASARWADALPQRCGLSLGRVASGLQAAGRARFGRRAAPVAYKAVAFVQKGVTRARNRRFGTCFEPFRERAGRFSSGQSNAQRSELGKCATRKGGPRLAVPRAPVRAPNRVQKRQFCAREVRACMKSTVLYAREGPSRPVLPVRVAGCTCRAMGCRGVLLRSGVRGACRAVGRDGTHSAWRARRALAALRDGGALDRCITGCGALVARWDGGAALCRGRDKAELALCWARTGSLRGAAKTSTGRNRGPLVEAGVSGVCWPKP